MDLKPLEPRGDGQVSEEEFRELFQERMPAVLLDRVLQVLRTLDALHSFSVANICHLALQKGVTGQVVDALERWRELYVGAPDAATAYVDTRMFFDHVYADFFMTAEDTIDGFSFHRAILRPKRSEGL
jgi:hypothetical protein